MEPNVIATSQSVSQCTEAYCTLCSKVLYRVPSGGIIFKANRCDCSWRCCQPDQARGGHHPTHIAHRPSTVVVTKFTRGS